MESQLMQNSLRCPVSEPEDKADLQTFQHLFEHLQVRQLTTSGLLLCFELIPSLPLTTTPPQHTQSSLVLPSRSLQNKFKPLFGWQAFVVSESDLVPWE